MNLFRIYLVVLAHIYYKNDELLKRLMQKYNLKNEDNYIVRLNSNPEEFLDNVTNQIYLYCDEKSKIKTILYHIYLLW